MSTMHIFRRFYHVSSINFNVKKQGLKLCKMVNPRAKSNKTFHPSFADVNIMPSVKSLTKTKYEPDKRGVRRIAVLNKLFMKYITDLMSTGTTSMDIVGRGIEISKVEISPDMQRVNVFWICKGDATDEETEAVLNKIGGPLRNELSNLRLMGEVPYIMFVKDRQEARVLDLNRRLAVADYGDDYVPADPGHLLKSEFTLQTNLSSDIKTKIKQLDESLPIEEDPIPEMSHNVYGLDHAKILNRLLAARKKTSDAWSNVGGDTVISYRASEGSPGVDNKTQRQELAEFLQKRQILQNKIHRELRNTRVPNIIEMEQNDNQVEEEIYNEDDYESDDDEFYLQEDRMKDEISQRRKD